MTRFEHAAGRPGGTGIGKPDHLDAEHFLDRLSP
jgi:hypothetical protein